MSNSNQRTQRQILEYMVTVTQKLSRTCRDLSEIGRDLLKSLTYNDRSERYRNRYREKDFGEKDVRVRDNREDLNSNLIDEEDFQMENMVGINGRKKLKIKNRIEEAQEDEEVLVPKQPEIKFGTVASQNIPNANKKHEEKSEKQKLPQAQGQQQKPQDNKKKPKSISHKPKAPTSSFLLFFKQQQQSIAKSYPNYGVVELTKVAAKCWNELSVQEKDPYQKLFEVQRKKYQQEMEKYKKMFPEEVRRKQLQKKQKKKKRAKQRRQRQGKSPKQAKQPRQPKQKPIPIIANNDTNPFNNATPGGVKLEQMGVAEGQREQELDQDNYHDVKNEEELASDQLDELDGDSEENSLGEDI